MSLQYLTMRAVRQYLTFAPFGLRRMSTPFGPADVCDGVTCVVVFVGLCMVIFIVRVPLTFGLSLCTSVVTVPGELRRSGRSP